MVLYDIPSEPSRLKVRLWRDFKRIGAIYPPMSVCIIPDNKQNEHEIQRIINRVFKDGRLMRIRGKSVGENDQTNILHMFRTARDKQYEEILEECQEFIDEIYLNIKSKKTTQEEAEEMEESLNGLKRWFDRVKTLDWGQKSNAAIKIEKSLEKCEEVMNKFSHLSHPKQSNTDYSSKVIRH